MKLIEIIMRMLGISRQEDTYTADRAWIETTYGSNAYVTVETRVKSKQQEIRKRIEGKSSNGQAVSSLNGQYYCFVQIEPDIAHVTKQVFQPFVDGGFDIISVSDKVDELRNENIYLVSWGKAFEPLNESESIIVEITPQTNNIQ